MYKTSYELRTPDGGLYYGADRAEMILLARNWEASRPIGTYSIDEIDDAHEGGRTRIYEITDGQEMGENLPERDEIIMNKVGEEGTFSIRDWDKIIIHRSNGEVAERVCRYYDEYHFIVGKTLYHRSEWASRCKANGSTYRPLIPAASI